MPVEVRDKAESLDRYFYFLIDALTIGFVAILMVRNHIPMAHVGVRLQNWKSDVLHGIAAGGLLITLQCLLARLLPRKKPLPNTDRYARRSVGFWVCALFVGALAEEFWIAFCIVAMRATGHSVSVSVYVTAVVFGTIHLSYGYLGALSVAAKGATSALLFLWWGALIPMFLFHFSGNLGSLYWIRLGQRRMASSMRSGAT